MTDETSSSTVPTLSRRRLLAAGATLVTAGGTVVVVGEPASASVAVDSFSVADESFTAESVTPVIDVTAAYDYDVGTAAIAALEFDLLVGGTAVASDELVTDASTLSGETTLSGRVTESEAWDSSDFAPPVAESVSRDIDVTLRFAVVESDGSVIVSDKASDTATVGVSHPQESQYVATVGGSGTIRTPR